MVPGMPSPWYAKGCTAGECTYVRDGRLVNYWSVQTVLWSAGPYLSAVHFWTFLFFFLLSSPHAHTHTSPTATSALCSASQDTKVKTPPRPCSRFSNPLQLVLHSPVLLPRPQCCLPGKCSCSLFIRHTPFSHWLTRFASMGRQHEKKTITTTTTTTTFTSLVPF